MGKKEIDDYSSRILKYDKKSHELLSKANLENEISREDFNELIKEMPLIEVLNEINKNHEMLNKATWMLMDSNDEYAGRIKPLISQYFDIIIKHFDNISKVYKSFKEVSNYLK